MPYGVYIFSHTMYMCITNAAKSACGKVFVLVTPDVGAHRSGGPRRCAFLMHRRFSPGHCDKVRTISDALAHQEEGPCPAKTSTCSP